MARKARVLSCINSYTILLKANDTIDFNDHDLQLFLETVKKYSDILNYKFLAYNLNSKVLTFVLYDCDTAIDTIMKKICVSFVSKYNLYHIRHGKVFKERFMSIPATTIKQVWDMVYDVHSLKNGTSSKEDYFNNNYININCAKQFYGSKENFENAVIKRSLTGMPITLDKVIINKKMADSELASYIYKQYNLNPNDLKSLPKHKLTEILNDLITATKVSARQIARVTSLPLRFLWGIIRNSKNTEGANE